MNTGNLHPLHAWLLLVFVPLPLQLSKIQPAVVRPPGEILTDSGLPIAFAIRIPQSTSYRMVGQGRLELPTSSLSGTRSSHLSYWPDPTLLVELIGIEPTTS